MALPTRRLVSGVRADGTGGLIEDGSAPHVVAIDADKGVFRTDIWATARMPADLADPSDPTLAWPAERFAPLPNGTSFFVMEIPPDDPSRQVSLHRTDTLDYVIILDGEAYIVFEDEERLVRAGDILVQRGTSHAWSNRSGRPCRFAAIMLDAGRNARPK